MLSYLPANYLPIFETLSTMIRHKLIRNPWYLQEIYTQYYRERFSYN